MTPKDLAARLKTIASRVVPAMSDACDYVLAAGRKSAIVYSSGPYSQEQLDAWENPYSRRHKGMPPVRLAPEIINIQTGEFIRSWKTVKTVTNNDMTIRIFNTSDHAKDFETGNFRMIARPIRAYILGDMKKYRTIELKYAMIQILK